MEVGNLGNMRSNDGLTKAVAKHAGIPGMYTEQQLGIELSMG